MLLHCTLPPIIVVAEPLGCFWLSQGVYSEYTFGYPPKSGGKNKVYKVLFPLGTLAPLGAPPLSTEKGQILRNFNLP